MAVSFTSRRRPQELVTPARPTPHEYKAVSDIDDQRSLRYYPAGIEFFRCRYDAASASARDIADPVGAIRAALAEALVNYYPLAGRLLELPEAGGKLLVNCTAEGVVFVEADADVRLEDLGQALAPPYPCVEELLCCNTGEPEETVIGKPLLFFQKVRLQYFLILEHAFQPRLPTRAWRNATLLPVWERHLLTARAPAGSMSTHKHTAYDEVASSAADVIWKTPLEHMVTRYFRLGLKEIAAIRSQVDPSSDLRQSATTLELVAAAVWRCRTAALEYPPCQVVRGIFWSSARGSWKPDRSPIPKGFYGNALIPQTAEATAGELCGRPLGHALELVRAAKLDVTDEYMQSLLDTLVKSGRPFHSLDWTLSMADTSSISRRAASLGIRWERAGGGITMAGPARVTSLHCYYDRWKRGGEEFVAVSMCLPPAAMERFAEKITAWAKKSVVKSAL
ncbi:hypothetical protein EJB05_27469, partial [Eragrostis curvula]